MISEEEYPVPRPRDDTDAVQDIARDLAEAYAYLSEDTKYEPLHLRLETATGGGCMPSV